MAALITAVKLHHSAVERFQQNPAAADPGVEHAQTIGIIRLLLSHGANPNVRDHSNGTPPLCIPSKFPSQDLVRLLLRHGADPDPYPLSVDTPLIAAVKHKDPAIVEMLLGARAKVNRADSSGMTPVMYAAGLGQSGLIRMLVRAGAEVKVQNYNGETILMLCPKPEIATMFSSQIHVNSTDFHGRSALFHAVGRRSLRMINWCLDRGADINLRDDDGRSVLFYAAGLLTTWNWWFEPQPNEGSEDQAVLKLLLSRGANPNSMDFTGETPLFIATRYGGVEKARVLLQYGASVNPNVAYNRQPLWEAVEGSNVVLVQLLCDHNANVMLADRDGNTLLTRALQRDQFTTALTLMENATRSLEVESGHSEVLLLSAATRGQTEVVAQLLRETGVDINHRDRFSRNALSYAAANGHERIVGLLLEPKSIEINVKGTGGWTPLHYAARNGHAAVVEILLSGQREVNVNSIDQTGRTPLSHAAKHGYCAVAALLVAHKDIDCRCPDKHSRTPLWYAVASGHAEVCKLLLAPHHTNAVDRNYIRGPLLLAAMNGHKSIVEQLLQYTSDPDLLSPQGKTPLALAAVAGHIPVVELLISRGSNLNIRDVCGRSVLCLAIRHAQKDIVDLILKKYADRIKDNMHKALEWAVEKGHVELARMLLDHRVSTNLPRLDCQTNLMQALENRNASMMDLLLQHEACYPPEDSDFQRLLCLASRLGYADVVRSLMEFYPAAAVDEAVCAAEIHDHREVVWVLMRNA